MNTLTLQFRTLQFRPLRWIVFLMAMSLATLLPLSQAHAYLSHLEVWKSIYPDSSSDDNAGCLLCHGTSTSNVNIYGALVCSVGGTTSDRIRIVENLNSDQDPTGAKNDAEIHVSTQPGWTPGSVNPIYTIDDTYHKKCHLTDIRVSPPDGISGRLDPSEDSLHPIAILNGPFTGTLDATLQFNANASLDPDGSITAYNWDFGDGSIGTGVNTSHIYSAAGNYSVSLTVVDNTGLSNTTSSPVTVGVGNQAPITKVDGPYTGTVGTPVLFNGGASADPDGGLIAYSWNFGDGGSGSGASTSHVYLSEGTFNVTLTVMDNAGASDSASTTATIGSVPNQPPTADPYGPYTGTVGMPVQFDGSGSTDPEGATLSYVWNFGDGGSATGMAPTHTYNMDGLYSVSLTITDPAGLSNTASTNASIGPATNQAPTADTKGPYSGTLTQAVRFDGSASTDPEGGPLSYAWNFGDGISGSGATPTHNYAGTGVYTVSLVVTDSAGASDSASTTATIGVGNLPPSAQANGPYTGSVGTPLQFDASASSDPDGSIVAYSWDFGDGGSGTGVKPSHTYSAAGAFNVTLTVTDNAGASDSSNASVSLSAADVPALEKVDLDIKELDVSSSHSLGSSRSIRISLNVRNRGDIDAPRMATITGMQNGGEIYRESMMVDATLDDGRTFDFPSYRPSSTGTIEWLATLDDDDSDLDQATDSTRVSRDTGSNRDSNRDRKHDD